jgi:hypothetical protein
MAGGEGRVDTDHISTVSRVSLVLLICDHLAWFALPQGLPEQCWLPAHGLETCVASPPAQRAALETSSSSI